MLAAVEHEPIAAILLHSSVRDVDTVIVDGVVRKENGKLLPVQAKGKQWQWSDVAKEVLKDLWIAARDYHLAP